MGVAAARAKQMAEQLLGSRENAKGDAKHRAETLVDEGRRAAADVVNALRKEATVLFRDLEHLEEHLRGSKGSASAGQGGGTPTVDEPAAPSRPTSAARAASAKKTGAVRKSAPTAKAAGRKSGGEKVAGVSQKVAATKAPATKAPATKTPATKAPAARKGAVAVKAAGARKGGGGGSSSRGQA